MYLVQPHDVPPKAPTFNAGITPREFESYVAQHVRYMAALSRVPYPVVERQLLQGAGGQYEVDVTPKLTVAGLDFVVLTKWLPWKADPTDLGS